jgi:sulfur carrier protein
MSARIRVNGREEMLTSGTIAELLRLRGIDSSRGVAVAVNGVVAPSRNWPSQPLAAGDEIEIVRPFGGG